MDGHKKLYSICNYFFLAGIFLFNFSWALAASSVLPVTLSCEGGGQCPFSLGQLFPLSQRYSIEDVRKKLSVFISTDKSIAQFRYEIYFTEERYQVRLFYKEKKHINKITVVGDVDVDLLAVRAALPFKEGEYFPDGQEMRQESPKYIIKYLKGLGINVINVSCEIRPIKGEEVEIIYIIGNAREIMVSDIIIRTDVEIDLSAVKNTFLRFKHHPWDQVEIDTTIAQIAKDLFEQGHYGIKITSYQQMENNHHFAKLLLSVAVGDKITLSFSGNKKFSRQVLISHLHKAIIANQLSFSEQSAQVAIIDLYESVGIYNTKLTSHALFGRDLEGRKNKNIYFYITEGNHIKLPPPLLKGATLFSRKKLVELYNKTGSDLVRAGNLDRKFLTDFSRIIQEEYVKNGFLSAEISSPLISFYDNGQRASVEYSIKEGVQTVVEEINFLNVPRWLRKKIIKQLTNMPRKALDASVVSAEYQKALEIIKNNGYLFAQISDRSVPEMVDYSLDYKFARLNYDFYLGKSAKFFGAKILGREKTQEVVILREILFSRGETVTATALEELKNKLLALGIFSHVSIMPETINEKEGEVEVLLKITVKESDAKIIELAPGFRTDIGYKLSSAFLVNNVNGLNRSFALRSQVNRRVDLTGLNEDRPQGKENLLEYNIDLSFSEPYFLIRELNSQVEFSTSRKRFYAFDADIRKFSTSLSKTILGHVDLGLRYQLEDFSQFNGIEGDDQNNNDYFRIGGIVPSIALDWRDDKIRTKKGAYFSLSLELSNADFGSQNQKDRVINFSKIISRNRFYFPLGDWVVASSISLGREDNLDPDHSRSYIPSVKVFRMDGVDLVRGFSSEEINRLPSGSDVGEVRVTDEAYFVNYKIEPRYAASDAIIVALFLDAGRVYVNQFDPLSVRSAAGASLKVLTPIGTLDFDYGIKLDRRQTGGEAESFGRFHLAIGFF